MNLDKTIEQLQREAIVKEALSWVGTPYHHMGRIKGVGVDCSMLLVEAYHKAGLVERLEIPYYPPDWHLHRNAEMYLEELLKHAVELPEGQLPQPGDIALWKWGRTYSHGGIVTKWPEIVHAYLKMGVVIEDADKAQWLRYVGENTPDQGKPRPVRFFTFRGWCDGMAV